MPLNKFLNKINKIFILKNALLLIAITLVISCTDEGCVEADDFGDIDSQTLTVYSNVNQNSCDYDSSISYENQTSLVLVSCLTTSRQSVPISDGSLITSSTGCGGLDNSEAKEVCRQTCISECQKNFSANSSSEPSWVSTKTKTKSSSSGVNISPNSEITITAKGALTLGSNVTLSNKFVNFKDLMPNSYGNSTFSSQSVMDVGSGQSISLKFSKSSGAKVEDSPAILSDFDFAKRLVAYIIPHPANYKYNYSEANPTNAVVNVPLTPRFNGWKCLYTSANLVQSSCSLTNDNYSSDPNSLNSTDLYPNANDSASSSSFDVGSNAKKIIDYGGFIRWDNDKTYNYSYNPFANTNCYSDGLCNSLPDSKDGIIIGDISSDFTFYNNDGNAKELSFKLIGGFCQNLTISRLSIFDKTNREIYYINNFQVNGTYSPNKIPFNQGYKLVIPSNLNNYNSTNCGKFLAMRMLKYQDIVINRSGFISLRIVDNNTSGSNSPSCNISARIINPKGIHNVINDSATLSSQSIYQRSSSAINLPVPPAGISANVTNSYYGAVTLNNDGTNFVTGDSSCYQDINGIISATYTACITNGQSTCMLSNSDSRLDQLSQCSTGNGSDGSKNSNPSGGGTGGGGGGNKHGQSYILDSASFGKGGQSGNSYYSDYYNQQKPTLTAISTSANGSGGLGGFNAQDGQVNIYNCDVSASCPPTTFNYNSSIPYVEYNVPASQTIRYEIIGGGGGGGGNNCGTSSIVSGATGANSIKFSGVFKNVSSSKTSKLRIYVGGGGSAGYSNCSNSNYINKVAYNNGFSSTSQNISLSAASSQNISKIRFASYGYPVIKNRSTETSSASDVSKFEINPFCHSRASKVVAVDTCIGKNNCSINLADSTFNSLDTSNCQNGNGSNGASNTSTDNNGSGGGGGGGNGSGGSSANFATAGIISGGTAGAPGGAGTSGDSYYDPAYHSTAPLISSSANAGSPSIIAGDGSVQITDGGSVLNYTTPGTFNKIASSGSITYELKGAGGGAGGNYDASKQGGTGASGSKLSGSITVNSGDQIRIDVGEKGQKGAGACLTPPPYFYNEGTTINLATLMSGNVVSSSFYGTAQRQSDTSYVSNSYCNIDTTSVINAQLTNSAFLVSSASLGTPAVCSSGDGSSALTAISLTNAGGGGGGGGGNGFGTSGIINAGSVASNTVGGAGNSAESFYNPYYSSIPTSFSSANGANTSSTTATDGLAILKATSATADASAYVNLNSAQSGTYTATANGTIYYKIHGAGGGKGDKNLSTQTVNPGNGAPGNELIGSLLNVKIGDVIKVFVGKAGTNGASCTNNSYFNYANEFSKLTFDTPFAITGINFANYGTPNISLTPYTTNASCSLDVKANSLITACINKKTCTIYATNLTFGSNPCPPTATQNQYAAAGTNYTGTSTNQGGGGGGGGGGSYIATAGGSATPGVTSGKGVTGPSYFNPTYISATPEINSSGGAGGSKGKGYSPGPAANGGAGGNGSIKICNSDGSSNCIVYNTPGVYEATIPSDAKFYFEVKGGGGGGGSPNISAKSPVGGSGANGSYVFGIAQNSLTADNKIYVYVGGGGGGGVASSGGSRTGGSPTTTSLYFLGAKGGDATQTYKGTGGGGGSASFIVYNGQLIVLASGGGGGGGGGEEQSAYSYVDGEDATSNTTLNNTGASFIYTLKKLAIEAISSNSSTKGIGGYVPAYQTSYLTNILSGGDGSETKSGANCVGGGGGGGGGGTMITINDEVAVISGGGGGGGGINSSDTPGNNASANTTISTTLKVAPAKKKLVINYSPNIATPTPTASDTLLLGGDGGAINKSSSSYCSNNSNGQGGSGGGGTMLSINNRVIAIAGGGGGGGGASINDTGLTTKNATNSNNILDKLKAGPFGKYMAVALEYRSGSSGIINITQQSTGDLSIPALPANGVINDIAFASFGENSTSPFYYAGNCSKEENLKTALETNCLFRNSCINTIAISSSLKTGLSCTPSPNPALDKALAKLTYHTPNQSSTQAKYNLILKGGNGGALGSSECSGGGGSGGGASAISVLTNSDFTSASEHFIAIAGGGGGGGGASCDGTTGASDANGISQNTQTDLINGLNNTSLGKWLTTNVSFPRYTPRVIPEDFYEYDDFSITDNNSSDPLKSFNVNTSGFTPFLGSDLRRDKVFVRKGQIIRFSPKSWDSNWRTKNNLDRQCGIGMAIQVEPRPALICVGKRNQRFLNPDCLQNIDLTSSSSPLPNGCKPDSNYASSICNNPNQLCTKECYKKINCTGTPSENNLFSRSPCSVSGELETPGASCVTSGTTNIPANCTICNNARNEASKLAYYIQGNYDNCYDLEDYEGKIYNVIANANDEPKINDLINNKKLKVLSGFNGLYGNLENYNKIGDSYETKYPITASVKGRMKFMIVDGYDLNIPSVLTPEYTNFYQNNVGYATISPSISLNGRNGEWLEIKLCKETSGYDCKSLSITPLYADLSWNNTPNPSIIKITPQSQVSFDSVNYAFDSNGMLTRITDPIARDCTLATAQSQFGSSPTTALFDPNSAVITSKSSKFYCHTDQTSQSNLRLSFKIFDPEYLDCNLSNGSSTAPLNGVKINNLKYSVGPGNDGNTCSQTESISNNCVKQFSCVDRYSNNSGSYEVKIKVKNSRGISQIVNNIVQPVLYWMDGNSASSIPSERIGIVEGIYKSLISNPKYKLILKLSLSIFVMFYGLGYLMGVSELSQAEVVTRIFKIGFIYIFVGENGWLWFKEIFVNIFKEGVIQASFLMASSFDNSLQLETAINTGNYQNTALLFGSVDKVISILFSSAINKKIWAFLFTGIFGWAYVLVFYFSILNYIYALSNAVLLFITAQIMISILFVIGPIFFIFLLFNQTKDMFDNWLKALVGFGLQLIFLITTLTFFNLLMVEVLKMALGYKACWDDAWVINLGSRVTLTQFWTIPTLPPRTNMAEDLMNTGSPDSIPSFFSIIYIWVIASLTTKMVTFMTDAASSISEGIKASQIGGGIKQTASFLKQGLQGFAQSQIWDRTAGRALDTLDNKLFASGKTAKKERQENRRQASEDMSNRRSLVKAADKAEENFKKNPENINAFAKKNPETQKEIVKQIRQEAMEKRGEALGLNKADVRRISSGSGLKYYGTNVFGATLQGMKQGIFKGGALFNPIKDKYNNKISRKDAENAMKDMDKKDREQFIEGVKDGKINVARTLTERLKRNPLQAGKRGIKAIARRINDNFNPLFNKDYKNAALELQNEGKIIPDLYYKGRSDKEKALIRDRVAQNRDKAKRTGKKTVAKKLLNKFDINAKKKLKMQKDNLGKLLDENSDRTDLEELDEIVNDAQDIIDSDDDGADNAKEVLEQFVKIDNLKDEGIVRNFLKQDNVKNIMKKSDV